jgi:formylglycine-generating enzyme required for sulfatase activity
MRRRDRPAAVSPAELPYQEQTTLSELGLLRPSRAAARRLAAADSAQLARWVEDPREELAVRLAAGGVLGLLGDPRLGPAPATCFVPGGEVEIGLDGSAVDAVVSAWRHVGVLRSWIEKETPAYRTRLDDFWIAAHPVTNEAYRDFLDDTGYDERPTTWYLGAFPYERSNHPVAGVTAEAADSYAAWLGERTGHPWRLPTEAEWEYAAKGKDGWEFPWGGRFRPECANTRETGIHTTTPVGAFPEGRSWCGALDMAGNVEEYVSSTYHPYPGGPPIADDLVEALGSYRITRGGSFARYGDLTRTRRRHGAFPGPLYPVGFRLATSVEPGVRTSA